MARPRLRTGLGAHERGQGPTGYDVIDEL
jgi:hypothetical protein